MAKTAQQLITIMRNVTGRVDRSDPLFTDSVMLQYLNDFIVQLSTQEVRLMKNKTWWEFDLGTSDDDPFPVDLDTLGYSTIGPLAYVDGFPLSWFQDPGQFFARWPETQTYLPTRPTYVLYYNNELVFRAPVDQTYSVKIEAYQHELMVDSSSPLNNDYLFRYLTYGASLDIFSDYGEMDRYNEVYQPFDRYKKLVYARTYQQQQNQRSNPEF
jgi:hypothetical protein